MSNIKVGSLVKIKNDEPDGLNYIVQTIYDDNVVDIISESGIVSWEACFELDELELI